MTARHLWRVAAVVAALALASLLAAGARLGWHMAGQTAVLPVPVAAPPVAAGAAPPPDTRAIVALAPFGQPVQVAQAARPDSAPARLDIVLRGVIFDVDPVRSRAFVVAGGDNVVLWVGDSVQSAKVMAIDRDTMTVQAGDRTQVIGFDGVRDAAQDTAAPDAAASPPDAPDPMARLAAALVAGRGSIDLREGPPPQTTEDYIRHWRDRITRNPQAVMDSIGVEPVANGYRIKPEPDIGVTMAGLRPGDVVTRLNGEVIGDPDRDRVLYDTVAASGIARLEVLRDGQPLILTFPLR